MIFWSEQQLYSDVRMAGTTVVAATVDFIIMRSIW